VAQLEGLRNIVLGHDRDESLNLEILS